MLTVVPGSSDADEPAVWGAPALIDEIVRNGGRRMPREVLTSAGVVEVTAPRVNDRRVDPDTGERQRLSSAIRPPRCRKTRKINEVLPLLYLHACPAGTSGPRWGELCRMAHRLADPRELPPSPTTGGCSRLRTCALARRRCRR